MSAKKVGERLVELCSQGENIKAVEELYSDDITSIEAQGTDEMPARMQGKDQIKGKNQWWFENFDVHRADVDGPFLGHRDDQFVVHFDYDVTNKESGDRQAMREVALYTVKDGKVVQEEFLYLGA